MRDAIQRGGQFQRWEILVTRAIQPALEFGHFERTHGIQFKAMIADFVVNFVEPVRLCLAFACPSLPTGKSAAQQAGKPALLADSRVRMIDGLKRTRGSVEEPNQDEL
jgi:hypothetical protein